MDQPQSQSYLCAALDGSTWIATVLDQVSSHDELVTDAEYTWRSTETDSHTLEEPQPYCHLCNKQFSSVQALGCHWDRHKSRKIYKCKDCCSTLFGRHRFELHQIIFHFNQRSIKCEICLSLLLNTQQFRRHLKTHPNSVYLHLGTTREQVYKSAVKHRSRTTKPLLQLCDVCGDKYVVGRKCPHTVLSRANKLVQANSLKIYKNLRRRLKSKLRLQRLRQQRFWTNVLLRCPKCHTDFDKRHLLKKHLNNHCKENDFWCSSCVKSFSSRQGLVLHKKLHTKKKQFECFTCCKKFSLGTRLHLHRKSHLDLSDISISTIMPEPDPEVDNLYFTDATTENSDLIEERHLADGTLYAKDFDEFIEVRLSGSECESDSKSKSGSGYSIHPSDCTTITGTDEELGRSLSDFDDEEIRMESKIPSPNLGDQSSNTFPDVQGDLDLQELTSAWHMLNSGSNFSETVGSPSANMSTSDKFFDTQEFSQDIEAVLNNGRSHSSIATFFQDENEIPDLDFHGLQQDDESSERLGVFSVHNETSLVSVNPHSIIPDPTRSTTLNATCIQGDADVFHLTSKNSLETNQTNNEIDVLTSSQITVPLPSFRCGTCQKTFKTKTCLQIHEMGHAQGPVKFCTPRKKFERRGPHWYTVAALREMKSTSTEDRPPPSMKLDQLPTPIVLSETEMVCSYSFCGKNADGSGPDCYKCSRQFRSQRNFWAHQASHYGDKPFHCNICPGSVRFRDLKSFRQHIDEDHSEKKQSATGFKCPTCSEYSTTFQNTFAPLLDARQRAPRKDGPSIKFKCQFALCGRPREGIQLDYDCFQCDGSFDSFEYLELHKELHVGSTPFPCNVCKMCFETIGDLQDHINKKHDDVVPSWAMFTCGSCHNSYQGRAPHRKHLRTYSGRATKNKNMSDDSAKLMAPVLPEPTSVVSDMEGKCTDAASSKNAPPQTKQVPLIRLDEILEAVGIRGDHGGIEELELSTVDSSGPLPATEVNGVELSSGIKKAVAHSLKCPECGEQFNGIRDLRRHLKTHAKVVDILEDSVQSEEKSPQQSRVECELCSSDLKKIDFMTIGGLRKHYRNHHPGSVIYTCQKCVKAFTDESALKIHKEQVHFWKL